MILERTYDAELVNRIITHPKVYPWVRNDYSAPPEEFDSTDAIKVGVIFLEVAGPLGVFMFQQHNGVLWEVHTCLLPECWGARALKASQAAAAWMFENTTCQKIMTWVPVSNRLAYHFALKSGMKDEGLSVRSILRGGKLEDQHLLGLEKPCQPQSR